MSCPTEAGETQSILMQELNRANLSALVLNQETEDIYESSTEGGSSICTSSEGTYSSSGKRNLKRAFQQQCTGLSGDLITEITPEGAHAIDAQNKHRVNKLREQGFGVKLDGLIVHHEMDVEETVSQQIEKIMNRIIVRRQRAYLVGLLKDPAKARTAKLIEIYKKNAGLSK